MSGITVLQLVCRHSGFIFLAFLLLIGGCSGNRSATLMPTPVMYETAEFEPFSHIHENLRTPVSHVFYATNRRHKVHNLASPYGNSLDESLHLGKASVRIGEPDTLWEELTEISLANDVANSVPLSIESVDHWNSISSGKTVDSHQFSKDIKQFIDAINWELDHSIQKEIMVYVHGTKVDFDNSLELTAEIDHFAGRDFVGVAFSWPSHQNILSYLIGVDVKHARRSSQALIRLLTLLSENTNAEHINILSYSAGGRVTSKALHELRQLNSELDSQALRDEYRIGAVVFAAADVEVDQFLHRLEHVSELSQQVVITVSDDDVALNAAKKYMGGSNRAGTTDAEKDEIQFIKSHHLTNVQIVDVSLGKDDRGFDIIGHHYWYRHPWMSSDIIFLMRTDLPPSDRGLTESEVRGLWYLSDNYPDLVKDAIRRELGQQWAVPTGL